jgi:methionine synthase II (cobalamin-independent)
LTVTEPSSLDRIRVDVVGSFLRPASLKEARDRWQRQEISEDDWQTAQDQAVRHLIAQEEALGLPIVTDGEFRRYSFQDSFGASVAGIDQGGNTPIERVVPGGRAEDPSMFRRQPVLERLELVQNQLLEEFRFAKRCAQRPIKVTLLGPGRIMQRFDPEGSRDVYADVDAFLADVVAIERQMVSEVVAAGCRYVQLDEPSYTAYVDPSWIDTMRGRGEDPDHQLARAIAADNAVMAGFPGVTFGVHVCRGNRQGMYHREGSYDAIAERVFGGLECQRLLLEYDTERAGGFEPLRFVPADKVAVLGLVSTKLPQLEDGDRLKRRLDEASKHLGMEQLAVSPQCGFSSGFAGTTLSEDDQWRKVELLTETAAQLWK